jgi:hypothetical protein
MNTFKKLFYKYFWKDIYYETKWSLWGIFKYLNITRKMRPWDYIYILEMLQFQLTILKHNIEDGNEVDDSKYNKIKDIQRSIDIINNILTHNYIDRLPIKPSWYRYDGKISINRDHSPEVIKMDSDIMDIAIKLEEDEWNELWDTFKKGNHNESGLNSWWD